MISVKGGGEIEDTLLFGKYQLCRIIGTGRMGTVYLAVHQGLEEYRAIKRVPKNLADYERFRQEALILKELRHPGIPIVYDFEEDEDYSYLIEEYLEGEPLLDLLHRQGHLATAKTIHYGIQICHLVNYLHSAKPNPILYLDLQPKNLLVYHETVKLIDFDHAAHAPEANAARRRYGTIGCAAPEQYTGDLLDERTDIYAIGVLLYYLLSGTYPGEKPKFAGRGWGRRLTQIIETCLEDDRKKRYETVSDLCLRLEEIHNNKAGVFKQNHISSLTIALIGSKSGVGTTHLAIGLSAYLAKKGIPNVYEEKNQTGAVRQLSQYFNIGADSFGLYHVFSCILKPFYGEAVKLKDHPYQLVIRDYGTNMKDASQEESDILLLICGGKWWDLRAGERGYQSLCKQGNIYILYNHMIAFEKVLPSADMRNIISFQTPYFSNPFLLTSKAESFYEFLLRKTGLETKTKKEGPKIRYFLEKGVRAIWMKIGGP